MARYSRPATRRSYDTIHADISAATVALAHNEADAAEFWRVQTAACERLRDLWNEIVFQAADDKTLPKWAGFAAMTTRDDYAARAREARRVVESARQ